MKQRIERSGVSLDAPYLDLQCEELKQAGLAVAHVRGRGCGCKLKLDDQQVARLRLCCALP